MRGPVIILAAVVVIVTAGLCLLDAHGGGLDLCLSLVAVTVGVLVTIPQTVASAFVPARVEVCDLLLLDRPAPPPKA